MYWEPELETLPAGSLSSLALERWNQTLERAACSPYYHKVLRGRQSLKNLAEVEELPFTSKQDLRGNFPYGFLSCSLEETVRLHSSSGTTGNPTVVFHTQDDLSHWANLIARCMYMAGARRHDVFQNMMGYGLFTGGLGFHYGAERLGMLTIPVGPGNSKRQIWFLRNFKTSVIHILPSYALRLASFISDEGLDLQQDLNLKIAFIGAEPHSDEIRQKIETLLGVKAYNSYGLSEMCGPGVAFECEYQQGLHLWEDSFYMEIIDPLTGRVLDEGETGELVLTTLTRKAMPLLRYRTRDLTCILPGRCPCGRTSRRIDRIKGRDDDMLIINGVNIFPIQVEKVLMRIPQIGSNYLIEVTKENYMDKIYVKVELKDGQFGGTFAELERLQDYITHELKDELLVTPAVKLVEPGSLPVQEGKAVRVNDLRGGNNTLTFV